MLLKLYENIFITPIGLFRPHCLQSRLGIHIRQLIFVNFYKKKTVLIGTNNASTAPISLQSQEGGEEVPREQIRVSPYALVGGTYDTGRILPPEIYDLLHGAPLQEGLIRYHI